MRASAPPVPHVSVWIEYISKASPLKGPGKPPATYTKLPAAAVAMVMRLVGIELAAHRIQSRLGKPRGRTATLRLQRVLRCAAYPSSRSQWPHYRSPELR